jgi:hypothetical protein
MSVLGRLGPAGGTEDHVCRLASAAARLLRAYAMQFEAYRRLRHGGDQYVRVEHVHINEGAQAVIGNVHPQESGRAQLAETQSKEGGAVRFAPSFLADGGSSHGRPEELDLQASLEGQTAARADRRGGAEICGEAAAGKKTYRQRGGQRRGRHDPEERAA